MSRKPRLRTGLLCREVEDDFLVYEPDSGEVYLLNATAASIIELCDGKRDAAAIAAEILAVLEADAEAVRADVERTLQELDDKQLLEWNE